MRENPRTKTGENTHASTRPSHTKIAAVTPTITNVHQASFQRAPARELFTDKKNRAPGRAMSGHADGRARKHT